MQKCILFECPLSNMSVKPETSLMVQGSLETDYATTHLYVNFEVCTSMTLWSDGTIMASQWPEF